MSDSTKPTRMHVVMSILVIAFAIVLVSFAISVFTVAWDPCSPIVALVMLPMSAALAIQQYRGTFRHVRSAAYAVSTTLYVVGAIAALGLGVTFVEIAVGGELQLLGALWPILILAVFAFLGGWLNWRWYANMPKDSVDAGWRFSVRETLAAIAAVSLLTAMTSSFIRSAPHRYAENVSVAETPFGLPPNATDVSFCQGFRGSIAYEFSIDEDSFREWVAGGIGSYESDASNTKLEPIVVPVSIERFNAFSAELNGPNSITVNAGLEYAWSFEDRVVHAVFDSTTNRAYYNAHFH